MASVVAILVWLIVLLPQHCKPFTHSVYTITKIDDYRVLPLVVVLAMPDHRPHAPYVDVPKWERRGSSSLAFVFMFFVGSLYPNFMYLFYADSAVQDIIRNLFYACR